MCGCKQLCFLLIFLLYPVTSKEDLPKGLIFFLSSLSLFYWFWISGKCTSLLDASSSLRSNTGHEDELDDSCGGGVEDEPLSGLVDNPGTTRSTKLSVFQTTLLSPSLVNRDTFPIWRQSWHLTAAPLIGVSVVFAKLA